MAQKRKSTTSRGASAARQEAPASATPTMNERLRSNGKWVFLFLAVVFAVSFVLAGVGTGGPSFLDLWSQDRSSEPAQSTPASNATADALAAVKKNPEDAQAQIALAQAYVNDGELDKVAEPADRAAELAPEDVAVQTAIADVRLAEAAALLQKAQEAYAKGQGGGLVGGRTAVPSSVIPGGTQGATPFQTAQEALASARFNDASTSAQPFQTQADKAYAAALAAQRVVTDVTPDDPAGWFRLGQIASAANDTQQAIDAYSRFVKLAPEDPLTKQVKEEIDRLQKTLTPTASAG